MQDLIFVSLMIGLYAITHAFVWLCARMLAGGK
jgi:hypothetical protein